MSRRSTAWDQYTLSESGLYLTDTTIANATSARHGLMPKLSGSASDVFRGDGTFGSVTGAGGGGLTLLEQHVLSSSASLDFTTCISSTYDTYVIYLLNLIPATNAVNFHWRASTNGGASYDSSSLYALTAFRNSEAGSAVNGNIVSAPSAQVILNNGDTVKNTANYGVCGVLTLFSPGAALYKRLDGYISWLASSATEIVRQDLNATYQNTTAVNAFTFFFSSGSISSGIGRCYGLAK